MQLSPDYSFNQIPVLQGFGRQSVLEAGGALAILAALGALCIHAWRRRKPLFFFIVFFFVTFAPMSNVWMIIGSILGERFLYLPALGLIAAAGYAVNVLWKRLPAQPREWRYAAGTALGIVLTLLAVRTVIRNNDWADERRFWENAAATAPNSYRTNIAAATAAVPLTQEGWEYRVRHAERALAILEGLPDAQNTPNAYLEAGMILRASGDAVDAKRFSAAVFGHPESSYWYQRSLATLLKAGTGPRRTTLMPCAACRTRCAGECT